MNQKVRNTFEMTRAFYKGHLKSANKAYPYSEGTREKKRTEDSFTANKQISDLRDMLDVSKRSPQENGEYLYKNDVRYGNCAEMTCVALYLADTQFHINKSQLFLATLRGLDRSSNGVEFGHDFALIKLDDGKWCVDPWANICCSLSEYQTEFRKQMEHWTQKGKRLALRGSDTSLYWAVPNEGVVLSILAKEIKYGEVPYSSRTSNQGCILS